MARHYLFLQPKIFITHLAKVALVVLARVCGEPTLGFQMVEETVNPGELFAVHVD